jgi:spore germination protein KB
VEILFGKILGKIICGLYVWYAIHLCAMVIRTFTEFIHILNMPETPIIAIISFIILLTIWGVRSGPENMGRVARVTFPILSGFVVLTFLIGIKDMDFKTLQPMLSVDTKAILAGSYTTFSVPFSELIVCLPLFSSLKPKANPKKVFVKGLVMALVFLLIALLRNMLLLGIPSSKMYYFASYSAISIVSIGEFFTRIEVLIGINVILAGFTKMCVLLFTASAGLAKICNQKDSKTFAVPCGLIVVVLATSQYENAPDIFKWIDYLRFYNMPFHVILPVLIWIVAIIKSKVKKQDTQPKPETPEIPDNTENMGSLD